MKFTICYTSKSSQELSNTEVEEIFEKTLENNNTKGITGILLYASGNFFQVLEGEKEQVYQLFYDTIYSDFRHLEIFVIMEKETPNPFFDSYSSSFSILKTESEFEKLKSYIENHKINKDSDKFKRLITPFVSMF